ncbi:MAG: PilZ domain-containing protein [Desulfobacterales bacterium]|nr:PilZ domain-containing protein [Desulfobacterales bacterium]
MKIVNQKNSFDKRIKPRKLSSESIFFASKNGFYEGRLNNFSRYGLFIETTASLCVGEIITIALPHLSGKKIKCKGQIIWRNRAGCGVELFRKRHNTSFRVIK